MEILILVLLLLANGLFAMYEIALVSSGKARLETYAQGGSKRAKYVLQLLEEPEKILSAIQVGITLIGIVSGAYGGVALSDDVTPFFESIPFLKDYADTLAMVAVVGIITYFSLVIGELVPKTLALNNPEKLALFLTPFMRVFTRIMWPFVWFLSFSTRLINGLFGIRRGQERPMTQEELKFILHESSEQGVIDRAETEMLKDVFRFGDKKASDLMTYRKEVVWLDVHSGLEEVLETIRKEHYSKYLVCDGSLENYTGVVSVKDIILMSEKSDGFDLKQAVQRPLCLSEHLSARRVLELFKKYKTKFGVVINEYGDVEGIVTLHDLTESVFGDIQQEDFSTLGGMAMYFLNKIPEAGDVFYYRNLKFEVVDMDQSRVDKLLVLKEDNKM